MTCVALSGSEVAFRLEESVVKTSVLLSGYVVVLCTAVKLSMDKLVKTIEVAELISVLFNKVVVLNEPDVSVNVDCGVTVVVFSVVLSGYVAFSVQVEFICVVLLL